VLYTHLFFYFFIYYLAVWSGWTRNKKVMLNSNALAIYPLSLKYFFCIKENIADLAESDAR
jgi:hypothetical protein